MSRVAYHNFFDSRVAHKNKNTRVSRVAYRNVSEKSRSNSGTKFVPVKLYLVHKGSLEKISSYFDTFPVLQKIFKFFLVLPSQIK